MAKATKKKRAGKSRSDTADDMRRERAAALVLAIRQQRRLKTLEMQLRRALKTADVGLESLYAVLAKSGYGTGDVAAAIETGDYDEPAI